MEGRVFETHVPDLNLSGASGKMAMRVPALLRLSESQVKLMNPSADPILTVEVPVPALRHYPLLLTTCDQDAICNLRYYQND